MRERVGRWRRRAGAVRRLGWRARLVAVEAMLALAVARALVLAFPLHAVTRRLAPGPVAPGRRDDGAAGEAVIVVLRATARAMPFRAMCLEQALAGTMMLRRRRIASTLHLGTLRGEGARFEAHAWLSVEGAVLLGGPVDRYTELTRF